MFKHASDRPTSKTYSIVDMGRTLFLQSHFQRVVIEHPVSDVGDGIGIGAGAAYDLGDAGVDYQAAAQGA